MLRGGVCPHYSTPRKSVNKMKGKKKEICTNEVQTAKRTKEFLQKHDTCIEPTNRVHDRNNSKFHCVRTIYII